MLLSGCGGNHNRKKHSSKLVNGKQNTIFLVRFLCSENMAKFWASALPRQRQVRLVFCIVCVIFPFARKACWNRAPGKTFPIVVSITPPTRHELRKRSFYRWNMFTVRVYRKFTGPENGTYIVDQHFSIYRPRSTGLWKCNVLKGIGIFLTLINIS